MLFGVRTTIGQEKVVAELLSSKVKAEMLDIYSMAIIDNLKGYMLIEAPSETEVRKLVYKAPHVRGIVKGGMTMQEIEHFFEVKPMTSGIERGQIVELTSGAFKGEKAKVIRVDETKEKITVEIIEAAVPIPITVDASSVRVINQDQDKM
jgi:transcriptional antiterminator NusG